MRAVIPTVEIRADRADELRASMTDSHGNPRRFPVVELFGPTIQGEGPDAGRPCWFVRFGGCDYRCSWCDSMHAVDPEQVRKAERLTVKDIIARLTTLGAFDRVSTYIVLSGGNPALHRLTGLVRALDVRGATVSVETQGSVWRPWLADVDRLVVSPKPPSSGMATAEHADQTSRFLEQALAARGPARSPVLKIVVGGEDDYEWAAHVHVLWPTLPLYLSALTDQFDRPVSDAAVRQALAVSYRRLCERAAGDERMHDVVVLPQLHVIAWGARMGV